MTYDTACQQGPSLPIPTQEHLLAAVTQSSQALLPVRKGRGRPASLSNMHVCLGIVLSGLRGFGAQWALWRLLCREPIGPFAPVQVVDQAVYNRLERAAGLMQALFVQPSRLDASAVGWAARSDAGPLCQPGARAGRKDARCGGTLVARTAWQAFRRLGVIGWAHQCLV